MAKETTAGAAKTDANLKGQAVGIIETRGLTGAVTALDAMAKRADVTVRPKIKIDGGIVTVLVRGDVGAVSEAVAAGAEAARRVGELRGSHVIPRPYEGVESMLP